MGWGRGHTAVFIGTYSRGTRIEGKIDRLPALLLQSETWGIRGSNVPRVSFNPSLSLSDYRSKCVHSLVCTCRATVEMASRATLFLNATHRRVHARRLG